MELGEPVHGALEQLGRAVGGVPMLIGCDVVQAEVGGEVHHQSAEAAQLGDQRGRGAVRVGHDRGVDPVESL